MSFEIRKFLEDGAVAMPSAPVMPENIAEMLAKNGVRMDGDTEPEIPNIVTQEVPPVTAELVSKPDVAAETQTETRIKPVVAEASAAVPTAPSQAASVGVPSVVDWKTELKQIDPSEVLKEMGYDDKMVGFFNKWRTDGNIAEYIKAVSTDYTKMSPEQVMRYQLEQDYPEFSPEDMELLYQAKIVQQYKLDPDNNSEMDVRTGKLLLAADAKKVREGLLIKQQDYILSAKPPAPQVDNRLQQLEQDRNEAREKYTSYLNANQATKDLIANKKLVLGTGENAFNYEIPNPESLVNILQNPEQYAQHIFNAEGWPIVEKQLFIAAAAIDHATLINALITHGKQLGSKAIVEPMENARQTVGDISKPEPPLTPAQALARQGVIVSTDRT